MKEYKQKIMARMDTLAAEYHAFMIRRAALDCGVKHIPRDELGQMVDAFIKAHPEYQLYLLEMHEGEKNISLFSRGFLTDNDGIPYECMQILGLYGGDSDELPTVVEIKKEKK